MNVTIEKARLTKNIELKSNKNGTPYCYFSVAENHFTKNPDGTYNKMPTSFIKCVAYNDVAKKAAQIVKGQQVDLEGFFEKVPESADKKYPAYDRLVVQDVVPGALPKAAQAVA